MKKTTRQFFLYRHRLVIGYIILAAVFFGLLSFLPTIAPNGVSQDEMNSVVTANGLGRNFIQEGNIIDLPYRFLQKSCLHFFGMSLYSIKLPSIIIAVITGFFIILLLNRWFKNDVAIVGSILTTLSTAFLFLAGNGTPLIMYILWLAVILWLGSKIVGNEHTSPLLVIAFFICIALSAYTPHLVYVSIAIAIAGILHPHLRFALKQLSFWQLAICFASFALAISPLVIGCVINHQNIQTLLFTSDFSVANYASNIANAFIPFFSFSLAYDSVFLAPLFGLATVALLAIGILASIGKMFTSRNTVVSLLVIYAILISGLNRDVAIVIIIPITILCAAGIESIIEKWYSLFPENPYAHLLGMVPVVAVITMIIGSGLSHHTFGYHYISIIADNFSDDIALIDQKIDKDIPLLITDETSNADFYRLLNYYNKRSIISSVDSVEKYAAMSSTPAENYRIDRIITSPKSRNSDRLYIYSKITENKGE